MSVFLQFFQDAIRDNVIEHVDEIEDPLIKNDPEYMTYDEVKANPDEWHRRYFGQEEGLSLFVRYRMVICETKPFWWVKK